MKKQIFYILFLTSLNIIAQPTEINNEIPLELHEHYVTNSNIQDGMYFKDINNILNSYFGEWTGQYDDKVLELNISSYKYSYPGVFMDVLLIKYKIEKNNVVELANTLNYWDNYSKHMFGFEFINQFDLYKAWYEGELSDCNQKGWAMIEQIDSQTIKLWIKPYNMIIDNSCPDGNIHILPTDEANAVVLIKQN